jgi:site-specific DNA recombinase
MEEISKQPIKCAIYARVSPTTHIKTESDIHQSIEESLKMCRNASNQEGNIIVKEYVDQYVSGKSSKNMPEFQKMMQDARDGKFQRIYARRVNRFGRNRADMISAEMELTKLGTTIKFVESGIDTAMPMGKSMMGFLAELAEMDRADILENTKRGRDLAMATKTKSGKPFGHPRKELNVNLIRSARLTPIKERSSWTQLEKDLGASRTIMIERLKEAGYWDEEKRCVK